MNDDIMKQIEQVASKSETGQRKMMLEAYIDAVCDNIRHESNSAIFNARMVAPPTIQNFLFTWSEQNRQHISIQISEVARYILRKELLGE